MKEKISGVYEIISKCSPERCYIGSAKDIYYRWKNHLKLLRSGKHHSLKLQRHYDKHGAADLIFKILTSCDEAELIPINGVIWIEQFFIDAYKPYFNCCPIAGSRRGSVTSEETKMKLSLALRGNKNSLGYHHSEETIEKLRILNLGNKRLLGRKLSQEHKDNIGKASKGHILSEEAKRKIGETHRGNKYFCGKHHTEESKQKLREINLGRKMSEEAKNKMSESRKKSFTPELKEKLMQLNIGNKYCLGRILSNETKKKIGDANRGRRRPKEAIEKTRIKNTGKKHTEETRTQMSESAKKIWAERRRRKAEAQEQLNEEKCK